MKTEADQIAAFLARQGATIIATAPAYGVDSGVDKARRTENRLALAARGRPRDDDQQAEHRAECAAEAFASGDREAGYEHLTGYQRTAPGRYVSRRFQSF